MIHRCPRCNGTPPLAPADLKGVTVEVCRSCQSILMLRPDLDAIIAIVGRRATKRRDTNPMSYFERLTAQPEWVGKECSIRCPGCSYNMYEVTNHGIVVDFCLSCQAVWFDEGELNSALEIARKQGSIDLIPGDTDENRTAQLICYMLETVTNPSERG